MGVLFFGGVREQAALLKKTDTQMNETQNSKSTQPFCLKDHTTRQSIQAVQASYMLHWHRVVVDGSTFVATASLATASFYMNSQEQDLNAFVGKSIILSILGAIGFLLNYVLHKQVLVPRKIIQRIDEKNGVFEGKEPLYPSEWKVTAGKRWKDPVRYVTISISIFVPLTLILAISIIHFLL